MARWQQADELAMKDDDIERLPAMSHSRTEAASRVGRARILLTYRENPSFFAVGQRLGAHHSDGPRCGTLGVDRCRAQPTNRRPCRGREKIGSVVQNRQGNAAAA
jgi:hypothetical protein